MTEEELTTIDDLWNENAAEVRAGRAPDVVKNASIIVRVPALVAAVRKAEDRLRAWRVFCDAIQASANADLHHECNPNSRAAHNKAVAAGAAVVAARKDLRALGVDPETPHVPATA